MFGLSMHELMIIGVIAVLLFGRKLPEVARSLGSSYREFRKGLNDFQSQMHVDTYTPPKSSYAGRSSSYDDYAEEPTAPKFDPPPAEPQTESEAEASADSEKKWDQDAS